MLSAKQIQELKRTAESLREAADTITSMVSNGTQPLVPNQRRLILLLHYLDQAGGTVTKDEYHKLGIKAGYDPKGLAAPFAYAPNNTVTWLAGDRVGLTPRGKEKIAQYGDWLATQ